MNLIKTSVALCTYNGSKYITKQLDSILNQTIVPDEIIICDDCSTDNTSAILDDYFLKYPEIVSVFKNPEKLGAIKNFEQAIKLTKNETIFLSDQDDIWQPNKVKIILSEFSSNPKVKLIFTNAFLIDGKGEILQGDIWGKWGFNLDVQKRWRSKFNVFHDLLNNINYATGATLAFKRDLISVIFPFELPNAYWHDAWISLNATLNGGLRYLDLNLIKYRIHDDQQVGINRDWHLNIKPTSNIQTHIFKKNILKKYPIFHLLETLKKIKAILMRQKTLLLSSLIFK
ncbi:hypothetical protein A5893_14415 [Pedobacter psychrophilus]|uniref:Glycosyltransferase 2-like domain-containing protein n=1 Tax=Pedobacter psychrophilus TaxID=1826909 RepID=A0A179DDQ3_9SPHI|nr:glycosyltransferase family 2 protein [Pedobacter psychrophilus]OAQ38603.1 hypothetical protein A5893_14415 [Pedobacter psychrophilus]